MPSELIIKCVYYKKIKLSIMQYLEPGDYEKQIDKFKLLKIKNKYEKLGLN